MQIADNIKSKGCRHGTVLAFTPPCNSPISKILHYCSPVNRNIVGGWVKKKTHQIWKLGKNNLKLLTLCQLVRSLAKGITTVFLKIPKGHRANQNTV